MAKQRMPQGMMGGGKPAPKQPAPPKEALPDSSIEVLTAKVDQMMGMMDKMLNMMQMMSGGGDQPADTTGGMM